MHSDSEIQPVESFKPPGEPMNMPPFDLSRIMEFHQKNLAALTKLWLVAVNGACAIANRQHELAATALIDMTETPRSYHLGGDPQEAMARLAEFAKKTMEDATANTRGIAEMVQKVGAEAFSVVQERIVVEVADWLSDPAHNAMIADFILRKLPPTLAAIDSSGLPSCMGEQVRTGLERVEIAPLAAGLLSAVVEKGHQQQLLDELLNVLEALVTNTPTMETVREKILAELPGLLNLYHGEPVVMNKIIGLTTVLIAEIRADPAHPVRAELDAYLNAFIERLRSSPEFASRLDNYNLYLLERPELADLAARAWNDLRDFLVRDARSEESQLRRMIEAMLIDAGAQLAPDSAALA